jgi:hypothetical protein
LLLIFARKQQRMTMFRAACAGFGRRRRSLSPAGRLASASEKNSCNDYSGRRHLECGAFLNDSLNVIEFIPGMQKQPQDCYG